MYFRVLKPIRNEYYDITIPAHAHVARHAESLRHWNMRTELPTHGSIYVHDQMA